MNRILYVVYDTTDLSAQNASAVILLYNIIKRKLSRFKSHRIA